MKIEISMILAVGTVLVLFGLWGTVRHKGDLMRQVLALQLMFLGAAFNFALGGAAAGDFEGQTFVYLIACLTGVQTVVCLSLFLLYFRRHKHLDAQRIDKMKG